MLDRPELNTFLVQPPNRDRSQIIIFLGPVSHGGINKERIFILAEVSSSDLNFKNQIQIFINQLSKKYQELEKENPLIAFESSLEWANRELRENFEPKEMTQISMIFGSLRNEHLQFASGGSINAHIFYHENEEYKNTDLIKNYTTDSSNQNIFFPNLISGVIHQNNFTLFSTTTVLNYLTLDRLQKIITGNKSDEICSRIENLLSEIEGKVAFGGVLFSWPEIKHAALPASSFKITPNESINRLLKKQKETAQIMSPAVLQSIKKYLQNKKNKNTPVQEDIKILKKITKIYTRLTGWQGKISLVFQKLLLILGQSLYKIFLFLKRLTKKIFKISFWSPIGLLNGFKSALGTIKNLLFNKLKNLKTKFSSLSLKKRILFPLTILCCIILAFSLFFAYSNQKEKQDTANYNQSVSQIKNKITEAESSLIYKNEDSAQQLIKEIKDSLAKLPETTSAQSETKKQLADSIQPLIYKLQKIQEVQANTELNLTQWQTQFKPLAFFKNNSYLIFLSPSSDTIELYDTSTKQLTQSTNEKISSWQSAFLQKDGTLLITTTSNSLIQFDPEKKSFATKETSWPNKDSQITLSATYNAKLYSVDIKNNQIFKHLPSTTGFGKGMPWLAPNTKIDLSDAISLAIDGNIYIGKKNGQIYKLEGGNLNNFNINFLDPVLTSLNKIYTKNGSDYLFVLDKEKKRVIIWSKNGNKLVSQLTTPELGQANDFSVDEKNKKIYILTDTEVISIKY